MLYPLASSWDLAVRLGVPVALLSLSVLFWKRDRRVVNTALPILVTAALTLLLFFAMPRSGPSLLLSDLETAFYSAAGVSIPGLLVLFAATTKGFKYRGL